MRMPILETKRLRICPFTLDDLDVIHQLLDVELSQVDFGTEGSMSRAARAHWLQWTVLSYEQLAQLNQPPHGDRAVVLAATERFVGTCGFVPCLAPFEQLPSFSPTPSAPTLGLNTAECGLYYAFAAADQRHGYATEAVKAMITFAFTTLNMRRIVATTTDDNERSIGVMRRVGMRIERNPFAEPPWLQVVGSLENPRRT